MPLLTGRFPHNRESGTLPTQWGRVIQSSGLWPHNESKSDSLRDFALTQQGKVNASLPLQQMFWDFALIQKVKVNIVEQW